MNLQLRIVIHIPLAELWTDSHVLAYKRNRYLGREDVKELSATQPLQFVVAVLGEKLKWINEEDMFDFWKNEIKQYILKVDIRIYLDDLPGNYGYFASEWTLEGSPLVILLEKIH
jgi:hypothetical protein